MALQSPGLSLSPQPGGWIKPYNRLRTNPLIDYEIGGIAIQDTSRGLDYQVWKAYYDGASILVTPDDGGPVTTVYTVNDVTELSLTFDQNMRPCVTAKTSDNLYLYWFDTTTQLMTVTPFPNASSAMVRLDDKRTLQSNISDILFFYIENEKLYLRQQRDRFAIPYEIRTTDKAKIVQVGMNTKWRIQIALSGELPECIEIDGRVSAACICADMSYRAGVPYDASDILDSTMLGYKIDNQNAARSWIEPLMTAYAFDVYEGSGSLNFRNRNREPAATFTDNDLAAVINGEKQADKLVISRVQETELPRIVNIGFKDIDAEHEPGMQTAGRLATRAISQAIINLPIIMDKDEAKQKAEEILRRLWMNRENVFFTIPATNIDIKPTDKVILDVDGIQNLVRIIGINYQLAGVIKCEGVIESLEGLTDYNDYINWQSESSGEGGGIIPTRPPELPTPLTGYWMDIPIVRDIDAEKGVYLTTSTTGLFRGGFIYASFDDGVNWSSLTTTTRSITGITNSSLPAPVTEGIVDWGRKITVALDQYTDTLSSISPEIGLQRVTNIALIGKELVVFERATLLSPGVYELTGFHRGIRGTNNNMNHLSGEQFVLMNNSTRLELPDSRIGTSLLVKYLAYGQSIEDVDAISVRYEGNSLEPYSVAHLKATPISGSDYKIDWIRRTRLDGEWRDNVEVALSETTEAYTVQVWNGSTMLTEQTVTTNTATVSASVGNKIKVYQNSSVVGKGFPSEVIIA